MVDTVPSGVQLTEVITPLPIKVRLLLIKEFSRPKRKCFQKPANLQLILDGDSMTFTADVRVSANFPP